MRPDGWKQMLERVENAGKTVNIALVEKYVKLHDAYLSVAEALSHAGSTKRQGEIQLWKKLTEESYSRYLEGMDGVIVPGGLADGAFRE